jgi:hypothetical protein
LTLTNKLPILRLILIKGQGWFWIPFASPCLTSTEQFTFVPAKPESTSAFELIHVLDWHD